MKPDTAIDFWFELASTYSYPAALRIEEVARAHSRAVRWRPFLLGPIFKAQGWNDSPFNLYPARGRYMWRDLERITHALGIPFRRPSVFPRNGLRASRVACVAADAPWLPEFVRRVYQANFARDLDISEAAVLAECLSGLAPDPKALLAAAGEDDAKARLRRNTDLASELGIFGAPTFVAQGELFWGNDRMEAAFSWPS